jgi:hypothetical protein
MNENEIECKGILNLDSFGTKEGHRHTLLKIT